MAAPTIWQWARHTALLAALVACTKPPPPAPPELPPPPQPPAQAVPWNEWAQQAGRNWPQPARQAAIFTGMNVLDRHQCTRCHALDQQPSHGKAFDCVKCHVFLKSLPSQPAKMADIAKKHGQDIVDRYLRNIEHLLQAPDLTQLGRRVRADWIAAFVREPQDLRPAMHESMYRTALTESEARDVARYFAAIADAPDPFAPGYAPEPAPPKPDPARMQAGKALFQAKACATCHRLGNIDFGLKPAEPERGKPTGNELAPNLRFARERMVPSVVVAWLLDPQALMPATKMPRLGLTRSEAELLRDYLFHADPQLLPMPADVTPAMPPAVQRPVGWAEVKERVLGKVCVHCHMNDHENDTGPGNGGGMGYAGIGLGFRTYERAMAGKVGPDGRRVSVFETQPGEAMPRILASMLQRRVENHRDLLAADRDAQRPPFPRGILGMPLGLPAMTDEEFGILRAWIDQGCPGPTAVTGKPGFKDGLLVPDGPIAVNRGCSVRLPATPPPAWASAPGLKPASVPDTATPTAP